MKDENSLEMMVWSDPVSYSSAAPHISKLFMQISSSGNLQKLPLLQTLQDVGPSEKS